MINLDWESYIFWLLENWLYPWLFLYLLFCRVKGWRADPTPGHSYTCCSKEERIGELTPPPLAVPLPAVLKRKGLESWLHPWLFLYLLF